MTQLQTNSKEFLQHIQKVIKAKVASKVQRLNTTPIAFHSAPTTPIAWDNPDKLYRMGEIDAYEDVLKMLKLDYPNDFYEQYKP